MANPRRFFLLCSRAARRWRTRAGLRPFRFGFGPLVTFLLLPATGVDVPRDQQHREKKYRLRTMREIFASIGGFNTTTPNTFFNGTYTVLAGDSPVAADNYFRAPAAICSSNAIILFVLRI